MERTLKRNHARGAGTEVHLSRVLEEDPSPVPGFMFFPAGAFVLPPFLAFPQQGGAAVQRGWIVLCLERREIARRLFKCSAVWPPWDPHTAPIELFRLCS